MTLLLWVIFGIINGLILHQFESPQNKGSSIFAAFWGIVGSISGGVVAYYIFGGITATPNIIALIILALEGGVLLLLMKNKAFKQS